MFESIINSTKKKTTRVIPSLIFEQHWYLDYQVQADKKPILEPIAKKKRTEYKMVGLTAYDTINYHAM